MHKYFLYTLMEIALLLISCQTESYPDNSNKNSVIHKKITNNVTLLDLDTTIRLVNVSNSKYKSLQLNNKTAKTVLYNHFKKMGYFIEDSLPDMGTMTEADGDKLSVDYDKIFKADINHNKYADAIITYWLAPPYSSSHCLLPHKAIIIDTDSGYQITNEDFIPDHYFIDSVKELDRQFTIFGYDWECANNRMIRKLRVRLTY